MNSLHNAYSKRKGFYNYILLLLLCWVVVFILLLAGNIDPIIIAIWLIVLPIALIYVLINSQYLIPKSIVNGGIKSYWYIVRIIPFTIISSICLAVLVQMCLGRSDTSHVLFFLSLFLFPLSLLPTSIWIYDKEKQKKTLEASLSLSQDSLTSLKAQINPHFLFNTLNTLYGTALRENAILTSEGIQKLSDMMRFMLHENTLDKIPLDKEIKYLNDYMDIQKLRTSSPLDLDFESELKGDYLDLLVPPMLLIPFVENAFKHAKFNDKGYYINIQLQLNNNELHFDIVNSQSEDMDTSNSTRSGIGLQNVRKRLQLLYPNKHQLIIRSTSTDFYIHLHIHL